MKTANRILSICIMLMGIAAVVIGTKLHQRRAELRDRGDMLAETIHEMSQALDTNSPNQMADRTAITADGKGPLGYQEHHISRARYNQMLEHAIDHARAIREQRDRQSDYLSEIGKTFESLGVDITKLRNPQESEAEFKRLHDHAATYIKRDRALRAQLVKTSQLINPNYSHHPQDLKSEDLYRQTSSNNDIAIERLQQREALLTSALQRMVNNLGASEVDNLTSKDIVRMDAETAARLARSSQLIKAKLNAALLLTEQNHKLRTKVTARNESIADLQDKLGGHQAQIETLAEQLQDLRIKLQLITNPTPAGRYDGKVVKVNYDYNYVVITHNPKKDRLVMGSNLTVARDREFICEARISKIFKDYALAEILKDGREGEVIEGDRVLALD